MQDGFHEMDPPLLRTRRVKTPKCMSFPTFMDSPPSAPGLDFPKDEALSRLILFGERSLQHALTESVAYYHAERPHQGKGNVMPYWQARGVLFARRYK